MNKRMVILTKSSKFGQWCVAGIDCGSGEWIRLVSTDELTHGALTFDDLKYENGRCVEVLDVVNVEILQQDTNVLQPENVIIDRRYYFGFVKRISIEEAVDLYKGPKEKLILGSNLYYVDEEYASHLGESLSLAVVDDLHFDQQVNDEGKTKTKLSFTYNGYHYSNMSVTDPRYYSVANGTTYGKAVIVVSIGTSFRGRCYKFVSAIYPLLPF